MIKRWRFQLETLGDYSMPLSPPENHGTKKKMGHQEEGKACSRHMESLLCFQKEPTSAPIPGGAVITLLTAETRGDGCLVRGGFSSNVGALGLLCIWLEHMRSQGLEMGLCPGTEGALMWTRIWDKPVCPHSGL